MIAADTLAILRTVAAALGELRDEAMFVGGSIAGALVTNSAPPRETDDIDGRDTIEREILAAPLSAREFLGDRFRNLLADRGFVDAIAGHLRGDSASQARLPLVLARMRAIAAAA